MGKFPDAISAQAIMEKRPKAYGDLQPEDGCVPSDRYVTPHPKDDYPVASAPQPRMKGRAR
jgi:hypothetical protein